MRKATLICSVFIISGAAVAQRHIMPSGKMTDEDIIKSAMSAAPGQLQRARRSSISALMGKLE
jgi:hypothetical protein